MVDANIERAIIDFCKKAIPDIRNELFNELEFGDEQNKLAWQPNAEASEQAFTDKLQQEAFDKIRQHSRAEIEDMVEFMPKPELAKMAEALVNLTSIKRRVSRGIETVGGPIDVAVISQSEGFVWIKRKHYFPPDLNTRYFNRVKQTLSSHREIEDGQVTKPRRPASARRGKKAEEVPQKPLNGDGIAGRGDAQGNYASF